MIRTRPRTLSLALALLVAVAAAVPSHPSARASAVTPETITRARAIRAEVDARYRLLPGRKLVVTEATSTGVVRTLTLVHDWLEPFRVVPARNGIYFAICPEGARCPYPARSAAWSAAALLPRRQALELALHTFLRTSVSLVVVALPTAEPAWVVFERDVLTGIDSRTVLDRLESGPAVVGLPVHELVDRLTRPRLYRALPILPPPDDTLYALRLFGS